MGLAGAAAWGFVGIICLAASGYAAAHGQAGCVDGNVLIWLGLAAMTFGFALLSVTLLALPATVVALLVAIILLVLGGASLLGAHASCQFEFFTWNLPLG